MAAHYVAVLAPEKGRGRSVLFPDLPGCATHCPSVYEAITTAASLPPICRQRARAAARYRRHGRMRTSAPTKRGHLIAALIGQRPLSAYCRSISPCVIESISSPTLLMAIAQSLVPLARHVTSSSRTSGVAVLDARVPKSENWCTRVEQLACCIT